MLIIGEGKMLTELINQEVNYVAFGIIFRAWVYTANRAGDIGCNRANQVIGISKEDSTVIPGEKLNNTLMRLGGKQAGEASLLYGKRLVREAEMVCKSSKVLLTA